MNPTANQPAPAPTAGALSPPLPMQAVGQMLPDFELPLYGATPSPPRTALSARLEGKRGAAVVFWSAVCSHCVRYDAYLNTFEERHPDLALLVVASRCGEQARQLQGAVNERGLRFPILVDEGGVVARQWSTQQTPRAFLVDPQRRLLYRGAIDNFKYAADPEFVSFLEPAIAEFQQGLPVTKAETASFGCAIQSVYYILPRSL